MAGLLSGWKQNAKRRPRPPFLFQEFSALTRGRISRPSAHGGEQRDCEAAAVLHQVEKRVAVDREQFAVASATALASRGVRSTSAISPNTPPGPTFSTKFPPTWIATLPLRTTYMSTPIWPSLTMVAPVS